MSWALHNSIKNWTLFDLTEREAQIVLNTLSTNELKLIYICQSGSTEWVRFDSATHQKLVNPNVTSQGRFPPVNLDLQVGEMDSDYFVIQPRKVLTPRLHGRYTVDLPITIETSGKSFASETIDVSEGGFYIKDSIPDYVAGYFLVKIKAFKNVYQIMCSIVENQKSRHRIQIVSEDSDPNYQLYRTWLRSVSTEVIDDSSSD